MEILDRIWPGRKKNEKPQVKVPFPKLDTKQWDLLAAWIEANYPERMVSSSLPPGELLAATCKREVAWAILTERKESDGGL